MPLLPSVATLVQPRVLIGGAAVAATAALAIGLVASSGSDPAPGCIDLPPRAMTSASVQVAPVPVVAKPTAPEVHSTELKFVFTAGKASYLKLADLRLEGTEALAMPRHGKPRLAQDDDVQLAIAPVALRDVPMLYASWLGRTFKLDNHCQASIVGFAVVSRLTGDPGYASVDAWTAGNVMKAGQAVLAAKLDGCTGTFARDASLPDVVYPTQLHDAALEQAARQALLASSAATDTQREWDDEAQQVSNPPGPWTKDAEITTEVLRHPRTGETFVSAHAQVVGGCGAPEANLWGLFRVTDGVLVPIQLRKLSDLQTIDQLIDIDDDGELELIGKSWLDSEQLVVHANGNVIEQLTTPFFGCPC